MGIASLHPSYGLETNGLKPTLRRVALSGIADKASIYEIS
jgi:hypothetical protein